MVLHASLIAASDGVWDNNGRLHQDLIVVDADPGVRMAPIRSDVIGFDRSHQAVRARIFREPPKPVEVLWCGQACLLWCASVCRHPRPLP